MRIAILVDASRKLGLGHFYRCLYLGEMFISKGHVVDMICQELDDDLNFIKQDFNVFRAQTLSDLILLLEHGQYALIITDFNKEHKFRSKEECKAFYEGIRNAGVVVSFDDYDHFPVSVDAVVIPYPEVDKHINPVVGLQYFTGLKYMFFEKGFYGQRSTIRERISEVLIFMGGTDPFGFSKMVLSFFAQFNHDVDNFILITGANSTLSQDDFEEFSGKLNIEFVKGTSEVAEYMKKADLAVVNSGLVKYEAAFLGLPLITLSNEIGHEKVMEAFHRLTSNPHLGLGKSLTCSILQKAFFSMNYNKRLEINRASVEAFSDDRFLLVDQLLRMAE